MINVCAKFYNTIEANIQEEFGTQITSILYTDGYTNSRTDNYPCFLGVLLTSILHNILSKTLAASPHKHLRNNGQW